MKARKSGTAMIAVCCAVAIAGCAASSTKTPAASAVSGTVGANLVSATATVKELDQATRMVVLRRSDGSLIKFRAGEEVRNLPQVKVGDLVKVTYFESLAYEVKKPGEAKPAAVVAEGLGRNKLGDMPGGTSARATTVTATIAAIDLNAMTVTLRGPDGDSTTIRARDPEKLRRVAVGDLVEITYTEALAVLVERPQ